MKIKQPIFDCDWETWVVGITFNRYSHWTRDIRILDVMLHLGPLVFGFAIWGKEHN